MTDAHPVDGTEPTFGARPAAAFPWKPLILAGVAMAAVVGVTGGVLGAVELATEAAAPRVLPPGPHEQGGAVQTVLGAETGTEEAPPPADDRRSPEGTPGSSEEVSPEWLDQVSVATGVPRRALQGYANAQLRLMAEQPDCQISWPTLAAIGEVESRHGTYAGGEIADDGVTTVKVIGIPLDGTNNTAAIPDTDGGLLDGDTEWDRAVGPMQFIPTTWEIWGTAADGGDPDPHNIDDASLSAARYLCADGRVLTTSQGWWAGILSYNRSEKYGNDVLDIANDYVKALD